MKRFARELFLVARQCGDGGLVDESRLLFGLAREASGPYANRIQFRLYSLAAKVLGWHLTGRLAILSDRWRS
jgi:hypothetical protein